MANSKVKLTFKPMLKLDQLDNEVHETIVLTCSCCPTVLETKQFLDRIELRPHDFVEVPITGITDTMISRGGKLALRCLNFTLKNLIKGHGTNRLIVIAHERCKKDTMTPNRGKMGIVDRMAELLQARNYLKGWLPDSLDHVQVEFYLSRQKGSRYEFAPVGHEAPKLPEESIDHPVPATSSGCGIEHRLGISPSL